MESGEESEDNIVYPGGLQLGLLTLGLCLATFTVALGERNLDCSDSRSRRCCPTCIADSSLIAASDRHNTLGDTTFLAELPRHQHDLALSEDSTDIP